MTKSILKQHKSREEAVAQRPYKMRWSATAQGQKLKLIVYWYFGWLQKKRKITESH